jgi:hypothetical protein
MIAGGCDTSFPDPPTSDFDGDGFYEGQDCNDVDASVFPGAEEVWYDGIDQDCAGDDDYDADGDGVRAEQGGGADCDDSNALISPLGAEVWYDDVDQDCSGQSDFDADRDGFDSDAYGGTDCDDSDGTIWPGAPGETWYDGLDQDCAGDDDYDADGDGYTSSVYGGGDCLDTDDTVFPGAEEVWYDGLDQDCAGDDDNDADGDGYASEDHGGEDCYDTDSLAYPGAPEKIDGVDGDCDGNDDDFAIDDPYGAVVVRGAEPDARLGISFDTADIDGDKRPDLAIIQESDAYITGTGSGLIQVFDNSALQRSVSANEADVQLWSGVNLGRLSGLSFVQDIDTDGNEDLAVVAEGTGAVYLITGAEMLSDMNIADADRRIVDDGDNSSFGQVITSLKELNGDGIPELVIASPADDIVYFFEASSLSSNGVYSTDDADGVMRGSSGSRYGTAIAEVEDLDGDGYSELAIGATAARSTQGEVYIHSGRLALPVLGSPLSVSITIRGDDEADLNGASLATGDFNGDGDVDLAIGAIGEDTRAGRIHIIANSQLASTGIVGTGAADIVSYGGATINGFAGSALAAGQDIDGDGSDDLVIGGPGLAGGISGAGEAWVVISGETGDRALVNAAASFYGDVAGSQVGTSMGLADINGDGLADVLIGAPGLSSRVAGEGAVFIGFSGF